MPARDRDHEIVKRALVKDGWSIVREHVKFGVGDRAVFIDMRAEKAADNLSILVEVKEFDNVPSPIMALATALGKYLLYRIALDDAGSLSPLYVAVSRSS